MPEDRSALLNPPTPSFVHLGPPRLWRCGQCGLEILIYPALPVNHRCANYNPHCSTQIFMAYYVMSEDHRIHSLHLVGAIEDDPLLCVQGFDADNRPQNWERRSENGELVFYPFDPERSREHLLRYDGRIQVHRMADTADLEKLALRGRHSG